MEEILYGELGSLSRKGQFGGGSLFRVMSSFMKILWPLVFIIPTVCMCVCVLISWVTGWLRRCSSPRMRLTVTPRTSTASGCATRRLSRKSSPTKIDLRGSSKKPTTLSSRNQSWQRYHNRRRPFPVLCHIIWLYTDFHYKTSLSWKSLLPQISFLPSATFCRLLVTC